MRNEIQYPDGAPETPPTEGTLITYVGGPYAGRRDVVYGRVPPASVFTPAEHGLYEKSVRCSDDGALRYVWIGEET